jgi:hypothetical protein
MTSDTGPEILVWRDPDGSTEGIDPAVIPREVLEQFYKPQPLSQVVRQKCIDCSGGSVGEVRKCTAVGCPLWPYRMGTNPFTNRKGNVSTLRKPNSADTAEQFSPPVSKAA